MSKRDLVARSCTLWRGSSPYDNSLADCKIACKE
jgi:hypothetical protein